MKLRLKADGTCTVKFEDSDPSLDHCLARIIIQLLDTPTMLPVPPRRRAERDKIIEAFRLYEGEGLKKKQSLTISEYAKRQKKIEAGLKAFTTRYLAHWK